MSYKNHFKITIPLYNVENWIVSCLKSVMLQDYDNYECIVVDDNSSDDTYKKIKALVSDNSKFKIVRNKENVGPLANAYRAVLEHSTNLNDEDIIVLLDGDDFFSSKNTLSILNNFYNQNKCWMTYGSYINLSDKKKGKFSRPVPSQVIENNSYRESEWCTSHLRSYKAFLIKELDEKDLKDDTGSFFRAAGDLAMMFPLLEMCGPQAKFVEEILYIWNDMNVLNEHRSKRKEQLMCEQNIRKKRKYKLLVRHNMEES